MNVLVLIAAGWIVVSLVVAVVFGRMAALNEQPLSEAGRQKRQELDARLALRPRTGNVRRIYR